MKKLSISVFALAIVFALASAFTSKSTFSVLSKSFAVTPGGTESTDPGTLYNSYVAEEIEAATTAPTIDDASELESQAESVLGRDIEAICFDDEGNKLCLVRVTKTEGQPDSYQIDFFVEGEYLPEN